METNKEIQLAKEWWNTKAEMKFHLMKQYYPNQNDWKLLLPEEILKIYKSEKNKEIIGLKDNPLANENNMKTNKEIPTAKSYYRSTRAVDTNMWTLDMVLSFADEYAESNRNYHLSKQAEVIAGKAKLDVWDRDGSESIDDIYSNEYVIITASEQSILKASEEYINNLK